MVTVFADSNYQDEEAGKENSWRYEDGVLNVKESASSSKRMMRSANQNAAIARGIDVSEHNGKIDWEKVKSSGIDFAIIRCGYGMDLPKQDDKYWQYNVTECERLGSHTEYTYILMQTVLIEQRVKLIMYLDY